MLTDGIIYNFEGFFYAPEPIDQFDKVFQKYELNPDEPWTAHIVCFPIGKLEGK